LSYLTRFPIDALKLDQSFLPDIIAGSDDAIVVSAVVAMGKSLKHRVIAEGVETIEQLAFLQAHGCDEGRDTISVGLWLQSNSQSYLRRAYQQLLVLMAWFLFTRIGEAAVVRESGRKVEGKENRSPIP